ncbi:MAG TPA: class E sortase [Mycobacteriales bacterium]
MSDPPVEAPDDDLIPYASGDVAPRRHRRGSRVLDVIALVLRTTGELAMTLGVVILLFVVYELYFTGIATQRAQHHLEQQFAQDIRAHRPPVSAPGSPVPELGSGIAVMYAPRLGSSWKFVVVEGTGTDQLAKGPGHWDYPPDLARALGLVGPTAPPSAQKPLPDGSVPSAYPGDVGNFVVSGHRTTHSHPFYDADKFQPGDAIVVETTTTWYVYKVTGQQSVLPSDVAVTYPVPDQPGAVPTQKLITLTTCNPRYSASHRLVISGVLAYQQPLSAGNPAALTTGEA